MRLWQVLVAENGGFGFRLNLTTESLHEALRDRRILWTDFFYEDGYLHRLFDHPSLKPKLPAPPGPEIIGQLETRLRASHGAAPASATPAAQLAAKPSPAPIELGDGRWFLQFEGSEFGPISINELQQVIQTGKIRGVMYVWKKGMENWTPVSTLSELGHLFKGVPQGLPARAPTRFNRKPPEHEKRKSKRVALVATAWWLKSSRARELLGICADISLTGVQVVLDTESPIQNGSELEIELVPVGATGVSRLQVSATVVWTVPEERRIGLHFLKFAPGSKTALERYIQGAGAG